MNEAIQGLRPEAIWKYFAGISEIPRCSKSEKNVLEFVKKTAAAMGLKYKQDKVGNVVVMKPASPGKENASTVVLQVHVDMVCEKNREVQHDFTKDPIKFHREENFIKADGTTLGADDGIGVAALLALLEDKSLVHGPIEGLFTIDEETGLTGANHIEPGFITGKVMMNLDSEEEGVLYIGCAGGLDTTMTVSFKKKPVTGKVAAMSVKIRGLKGGHSGVDIHLGRANAIKLLTRTLMAIEAEVKFKLVGIEGGSKHNAIPREAEAVILVPASGVSKVEEIAVQCGHDFKNAFGSVDPDVKVVAEKATARAKQYIDDGARKKLLEALSAIPHGMIRMSSDIPDLVETSTNLAVVKMGRSGVDIVTSQRSSIESEKNMIAAQVASVGKLAGAKLHVSDGYPGWQPNVNSAVLAKGKEVYKNLYGKEPAVKAIHAGLECGIINDRVGGGVDTISFGPTIIGPHSPDEHVAIDSVEKFWKFLTELLKSIS
ncbi:MAG: aminoacyl-histidine dipeptidase [Bacteroidetes bacterium]|nr:aminoacyl-histidine dipeptidase [Bacteroidota bacterium]MCL5737139.1 aminoacyl-histidine dipeptidase [Bacteroidota bacterium]